jgi:hypothetical protein
LKHTPAIIIGTSTIGIFPKSGNIEGISSVKGDSDITGSIDEIGGDDATYAIIVGLYDIVRRIGTVKIIV